MISPAVVAALSAGLVEERLDALDDQIAARLDDIAAVGRPPDLDLDALVERVAARVTADLGPRIEATIAAQFRRRRFR